MSSSINHVAVSDKKKNATRKNAQKTAFHSHILLDIV